MKKIILLLILFASLASQTAFGEIYRVNIGSSNPTLESGNTWQGYHGPVDSLANFVGFSFGIGDDDTIGDSPTFAIVDPGFTGYATSTLDGSVLFFSVPGATSENYYITTYSKVKTPVLQTVDPGVGTIDFLYATGLATLDGQSYFYSTYGSHLVSDTLSAYYDTSLNASVLSTPEPASVMLLGIGIAAAAVARRKRYSAEA